MSPGGASPASAPPRLIQVARHLRPYRLRLIGLLALTVCFSVIAMLPPLVMRAMIDRVLVGGDRSLLLPLGIALLSLPVLSAIFSFTQTLGIAYVGQHFVFDLRDRLYRHLVRLSMRFFDRHAVGMLVNRLMSDSETVRNVLTAQTITVVSDLAAAIFAISAAFVLNWRLALLLIAIVTGFVINFRMNITRIRRARRGYSAAMDRLSSGIANRLGAALTVKSFGGERREHTLFQQQSEESLDLVQGMHYSNITLSMNTTLLAEGGRAVIYFLGCAMVLSDRVSYGDVIAFSAYAMQLLWPAVRFSLLARQVQDVGVAADRIFELLDADMEVRDPPGAAPLVRARGEVQFDHVDFHYDPDVPVIRDVCLHVRPGETVALIGPTGCGKTTLLSLLLRFFDVTSGSLRIDGRDLREIPLADLRRQFAVVLQESMLFTASIAENIAYGRPSATRAEIEAAAHAAEIHDFIAALPDGYETLIGMEGLQMSVGQKQRIAIARAVAADPAILLMDEATSALDSESERACQMAIDRLLKDRTAIIVAHRLSTIRNASRIVLLRSGRIVESGDHAALMRANGAYAALYRQHMNAGVLDDAALAGGADS